MGGVKTLSKYWGLFIESRPGQIVVEGTVTQKTSNTDNVKTYWQQLPAYWQEFYKNNSPKNNSDEIPELFGVMIIIPNKWIVLSLNKEDYLKGYKKEFKLMNSHWIEKELPLD